MDTQELIRLPAAEIAARVRAGAIKAGTVARGFLDWIETVNPKVNAFALVNAEGAEQAARAVDRAIAEGRDPGPLAGVPFTVKDLTRTAGVETAFGSNAFAGNVPEEDATAVARLRQAGGLLLGKTTTPEFGHKALTNSPRHGYTLNPWNLMHSPGGSSGGAAAAVSCGMGPIALNTDGAGSARIPASCCGVLGLKGTLGTVPNEHASELFGNFVYLGLNARNPTDLAAALSVINGPAGGDPWSIGVARRGFAVPRDPVGTLRGRRILYLEKMGNPELDGDVAALMERQLALMEAHGATITRFSGDFDWSRPLMRMMMRSYQHARLRHLLGVQVELDPSFVAALKEGASMDLHALQRAPAERSELFRRVQALFDGQDLLVTPSLAAPPVAFDQADGDPIVINGTTVHGLRENWYGYTGVFNLTGHPAISIPAGLTPAGLPVGLHAVAPWFGEAALIDLAAAIDALTPYSTLWPPVIDTALTDGGQASRHVAWRHEPA
jgi:aspartyl-tRNA(Asn)/glutamyl-tRNA(Gln) amidotransferase subunit A